jgi:hypothetical protein
LRAGLPGLCFLGADHAGRAVGGAVVDEHHLAGEAPYLERVQQARRELGDVELLVETRNDDGELDGLLLRRRAVVRFHGRRGFCFVRRSASNVIESAAIQLDVVASLLPDRRLLPRRVARLSAA